MHIIWGLVWVAIGILLIKYTFILVQTFGKIPWAETHLGGGLGGTYTLYKLVGLLIIFLAFMYMFGMFGIITGPLIPIFGGAK